MRENIRKRVKDIKHERKDQKGRNRQLEMAGGREDQWKYQVEESQRKKSERNKT